MISPPKFLWGFRTSFLHVLSWNIQYNTRSFFIFLPVNCRWQVGVAACQTVLKYSLQLFWKNRNTHTWSKNKLLLLPIQYLSIEIFDEINHWVSLLLQMHSLVIFYSLLPVIIVFFWIVVYIQYFVIDSFPFSVYSISLLPGWSHRRVARWPNWCNVMACCAISPEFKFLWYTEFIGSKMKILYGARESEPIWMNSGTMWTKCWQLVLILGAIGAVATVWEGAEICFFCPVNNARFRRFPVGKFFYDISTQQRRSVRRWKLSEQNF